MPETNKTLLDDFKGAMNKKTAKTMIKQSKATIKNLKTEMGKLDPHEPDYEDLRFLLDCERDRLTKLKTYL